MEGNYQPLKAETDEDRMILSFRLPAPVPKPVSKKGTDFYITVRDQEGALLVTSTDQKIRQYYRDYKAYDYIPGEDTAMPRQLSQYMDEKSRGFPPLRKPVIPGFPAAKLPEQSGKTGAVSKKYPSMPSQLLEIPRP